MSCKHGNHENACDICDEVSAAYESGLIAGRATPPVLAAPANSAVLPTDDDPLNSQYFGKLLSRVVEYGFDGGHDDNLIDWIRAYGQACAAAERSAIATMADEMKEQRFASGNIREGSAARTLAEMIRART